MNASAGTVRPPVVPRQVLTARTGVAVVFGLNGLAVASWFGRVPAARDALGLTPGRLGLLLLALSAGALLALPVAGVLTQRLGTARTVAAAAALAALGLALAGVAAGTWHAVPAVAVGLFALGYGSGTCDVAMNVEAAAVERRLGRTVMPRFHAAWSLGTVAGAVAGAGSARFGVPIGLHLGLAAVAMLAGTLPAVRSFLPARATPPPDPATGPTRGTGALAAWREPRTLLIGLLLVVMAFTEGTANDWLALAFVDGHRVSDAVGALAFGVFVAAMTLGRTAGTIALDRWGRVPVLLSTIVLAAIGATAAVLASPWPLAMAGVLLWGLGASLGFPMGMSAAADQEDRAAARVSVVAAIGYTAFLAGPPLVGLLGDRVGSLRALLVVPLLLLPALLLVPVTRPPADARAEPADSRDGSADARAEPADSRDGSADARDEPAEGRDGSADARDGAEGERSAVSSPGGASAGGAA
ncbi:MFS transporter [Plantactinospora mayteni]|uniref:MFS transporter n=1 Tax=Plantactinospora mayteni TaxID=566021 RepID=A0ABQ4F0U4_9ACTN|nr:MFS transporter [Plantactinospora mayteni]GIH00522.1 MFS transporter [Plantactinospora mayteni]